MIIRNESSKSCMSRYEEKTLKQLQQIELMMMRDFDEFCEKNRIDYVVLAGTALGAVRHGGFIPWDDDIDILIDHNDYDRFLNLVERDLSDKYYVLSYETDKHHPVMNSHLCLKGTEFRTFDQMLEENSGIFLDIFRFDNIPDDDRKMKKQWRRAWFWAKLMTLNEVKYPPLRYRGVKAVVIRSLLVIGHYLLKIFNVTTDLCYRKATYYRNLYNNIETRRLAYFFDTRMYTQMLDKEDFFPPLRMNFDGLMVNVPNKVEKYLTDTFGDYMKIPPLEQRRNHRPDVLDFGPYDGYIFSQQEQ